MDYGHTGQNVKISDETLFDSGITTGVGTAPESTNPDVDTSIHSSDNSISWDAQPKRNYQNIGDVAMQNPGENISASPEFGEIINLEMPPGVQDDIAQPDTSNQVNGLSDVMDHDSFRVEKDRISTKALDDTIEFVNKYEKNEISPAELQNGVWDRKVKYLKNSYGRNLEAA